MSTYKDVYGILNLIAMSYEEKEPTLKFSLWPHSKKRSKLEDPKFALEQEFLADWAYKDPYEIFYEHIWAEILKTGPEIIH